MILHETSFNHALDLRRSPPEDIRSQQNQMLRDHLNQAVKSLYYKNLFTEIGCSPEEITIDNLPRLPCTKRGDLEKSPDAFFATDPADHVDLALTSGSTGDPVLVPYTENDLNRLAFNEQLGFYGAGVRPADTMLLCVTLDRCFVAGLAYYTGLVKLGSSVIRSGPGQPARQWELIDRLHPTGLVGVPTFLLKTAVWGKEHNRNPSDIGITSIITIGEPVRKADNTLTPLGRELQDAWNCPISSSYGATELETAFCECPAGQGGHIHPELMIAEIIDDKGNVLPPGEPGELVVTPLGVEGLPLVRFRTGDIARIYTSPCECGWQTPRLGAIEGRLAQRLKYRGTTLYPEMIFQILQERDEVKSSYIEVRSSYDLSDEITVVAGIDEPAENINDRIAEFLQARLRVRPDIHIRPHNLVQETMEKGGGRKLKRFFDFRGE